MERFSLKSLLLLVLFTGGVFAQQTGSISGKVSDANGLAPIEADVKLFSGSDSTVFKGAKCDPAGLFSISDVPAGSYRLEVGFIEYASLTIENLKVSAGSNISLDTIRLKKQNVTTDEILVEDQKGLVEFSADKKIFNVSQSDLNKGGSAIDVLKKVPMVDVDVNDNVSLRGSQNVKILVDDKPSRYVSLKQIPADAIERIELITNPPAKYESEGVTGLINIVMKKSNKIGFTGSVNAGSNYTNKVAGWGGIDFNFKKNPWTFFSGIYSGNWHNKFTSSGTTEYFQPASLYKYSSSGKNNGYWVWGQGGIEYEIAQGKTVGLELNFGTGEWFNSDDSRSDNLSSTGSLSYYNTQFNERNGLWQNFTGSLYLNNKLDDQGRELSGDITLSRNRNPNEFGFNKQDFDPNGVPLTSFPSYQRDTTINKSYNLNTQLDYVHPVSKVSKLEGGYKGTFRTNDNNFDSDTLNNSLNTYQLNSDVANHFKLDEYINAAYFMFSSSIKDFSYKLGLRLEQTNTHGELVTTGEEFKQNYFDIFPTVNVSQKIGGVHQLQLSYSRRITRPNIWRLNPFLNKYNPRFIYKGNPQLKPEYTDSYELSMMFYSPVITITPLAFYRQNHDVISNYSYLVDSNVALNTYRNASSSKAYGMDFLVSSRALNWVSLNGTLSLYKTKFDSDPSLTGYAAEDGFSWKTNVRASFTLKYFNLELFYTYTGKKITYQGSDLSNSNFDVSVSKMFLNDKLNLSLRVSDLFDTSQWGQDINAAGYKTIARSDWGSRNFGLNLTFSFGNTDEYYMKKKKTKQNTNEGTDQQDSNQGR
ncbi:MAG: TonB-dependent receptor [Ignavibacteria bacterium]|nr:TonB-dependent receptor [Ignavibacteria bacterium]